MKIYNTLSHQKEEFVPGSDEVKMYVCGVTPYDSCHVGHAMSYIIFDVVRRYLEFRGYKVKYVQNFTDIDDKIIARANARGIPATQMTAEFIDEYFEDMNALNIMRADIYPKATEEVPDIIRVVQGLIEKGHAYELNGDVYFRIQHANSYGKLSHRNLDDMRAGARIEIDEFKEYPLDFALWKAAKPGEPSWESPWGVGRPGWHIECSVMSLKYLGNFLDIHGGGQDLIFPHHENEIAQSEAFTGAIPFVKYWMHNGLMQLGEDKMSKSLGNLITVRELLEKYSADSLRLLVLSSHYRSPLTYSEEGIVAMERGIERLRRVAALEETEAQGQSLSVGNYQQRFIEAMDDDFNTAQAVGVLFDLAREINHAREKGIKINKAQKTLQELTDVLGLTLKAKEVQLSAVPYIRLATEYELQVEADRAASYYIELLIDKRTDLRRVKKWARADKLRYSLEELGIILEDMPGATQWRPKR